MAKENHTLYRHFSSDNRLLYIGRSKSKFRRLAEHEKFSRWFEEVTATTYEHYDTHKQLVDAEHIAIHNEQPIFNVAHNSGAKISKDKILCANYDLTKTEIKVILLAITSKQFHSHIMAMSIIEVSALEYSTILGITKDESFREIKNAVGLLAKRTANIVNGNIVTNPIGFIQPSIICLSNQRVGVVFTSSIRDYLISLKSSLTNQQIFNMMRMESIYAIRIYELLIPCSTKKSTTISIEQLKTRLQLTSKSYESFGSIKQKVIDPAIIEIARCTGIVISCTTIKKSRKIISIKFIVHNQEQK
jgi:plasmid replication initiation protein